MCRVFLSCVFVLSTLAFASSASLPQPEPRIIGGKVTDIAAHSYLVSLRFRANSSSSYLHKCAGSIYSPTAIITGAQCVFDISSDDRIMVVAGANTRTGVDGQLLPAKKWIAHPNFSSWTIDNDIAVLLLETPLDLNQANVNAISIREQRPAVGRLGTIAGWGYREEYGDPSYKLEEAHVPIVSTDDCIKAYGVGEITDRMLCAGYLNSGGVDACHGDTGGPLVVDNQLVGLVSWGRSCARPGYPGVYTFVGSLKKWVDDTISAN